MRRRVVIACLYAWMIMSSVAMAGCGQSLTPTDQSVTMPNRSAGTGPNAKQLESWIDDLNNGGPSAQQKARASLVAADDTAAPAINKALAGLTLRHRAYHIDCERANVNGTQRPKPYRHTRHYAIGGATDAGPDQRMVG